MIRFDASRVLSRFRLLRKRNRIVVRRIINRQRRQSRTLITRWASRRLGVSPQKRIRRRILLPVTGQATVKRLEAVQLSLAELMPVRWFRKRKRGRGQRSELRIPAGAHLVKDDPPYVDGSAIVYRIRRAALFVLGKRFVREYRRQWSVELKRIGFF